MTRLGVFVVAVILAIGIAFGGAYAVVVGQNPASQVSGPATSYGPSPP